MRYTLSTRLLCLLLAALPGQALAQVVGKAFGFAAGVTGGGDAVPATPSSVEELTTWLTDSTPRVITIDREFDFRKTQGVKTETGCKPTTNTCGDAGQDAIDESNWCGESNYPAVDVTYDTAATVGITLGSDKSLVGVGDKGVVRGIGFRMVHGVSNIIIQNIHITELNPQYIWGGDAITLAGSDLVWIDHCKFSLIGRQMIASGFDTAGRVTISNSEFDGKTSWSAACNGEHYWTLLFYGKDDQITLANNWVHDVSGRSPRIGGTGGAAYHAVNNYFQTSRGHNFDIASGSVLMESNVFDDCDTPILVVTGQLFNVPDADSAHACQAPLGRDCVQNALAHSGDFPPHPEADALAAFAAPGAKKTLVVPMPVDKVVAYVTANAGLGKLTGAQGDSSSSGGGGVWGNSSSVHPLQSSMRRRGLVTKGLAGGLSGFAARRLHF